MTEKDRQPGIEVEVKIPLSFREAKPLDADEGTGLSFDDLEKKLADRGFLPGNLYEQTDTYYNSEAFDLRRGDKALRIRLERDLKSGRMTTTLNYKGPKIDERTMSRTEIEFEVPSAQEMEAVLEGIGYHPAGPRVCKVRQDYCRGNVVLSLDKVDGLGDFLEIEIKSASPAEGKAPDGAKREDLLAGRFRQLSEVMAELGFTGEDTVRRSYLSMLQER